MKVSRRARRMQRHYRRMHKAGGLNLVSLMDIFTILVFFLMVNSSDVKVLDSGSDVELPMSVSERVPDDTLIITVTRDDLIMQGRSLGKLSGFPPEERLIGPLQAALIALRERKLAGVIPDGLPVTIMADKSTDYALLRRIMATCVDANFRQVKLAVNKELGEGSGG